MAWPLANAMGSHDMMVVKNFNLTGAFLCPHLKLSKQLGPLECWPTMFIYLSWKSATPGVLIWCWQCWHVLSPLKHFNLAVTRLDCILPSYPPLPPAQPSPALLCVSCTGSCFRGFNLQISILVLDTGHWWLGWAGLGWLLLWCTTGGL